MTLSAALFAVAVLLTYFAAGPHVAAGVAAVVVFCAAIMSLPMNRDN